MVVKVHLVALGRYGDYRMVDVPDSLDDIDQHSDQESIDHLFRNVFYWGQNCRQEQDKPSVSMGDVAELWGRYWLCCSVGWKELTFNEWLNYLGESNLDRIQFAMNPSFV